MKTCKLAVILSVITFSQLLIPAELQQIQGRHIRPNQDKCGRGGRCPFKEDDPKDDTDDYKSGDDKDRPPVLTRDGYPAVSGIGYPGVGHDYKPKPARDDYEPTVVGGGYHIKPTSDKDDYDLKPVGGGHDKIDVESGGYDHSLKPLGDPHGGGGGYNRKPVRGGGGGGGGYNPKPVRGGYDPKPVSDDDDYDDYKPVGGGGYNPKPTGGRGEDRPVSGGGYIDKPTSGRDDYRPVGGGGGYNPKPVGDRDGVRPVGGGGGYNPKPVGDRDGGRPGGGGGYIHKPTGDRDDGRPTGGGGYDPTGDGGYRYQKPKPDHGGYNKPKDDDYIDDGKDDAYLDKPIPIGDRNCICVPYYQCRDGHIVTDGGGIIDARKKPDSDVDLPLDGKFSPPSCGPNHQCCSAPESSTVRPYEHRCGSRNPSGINSRILSPSNKGEADFGEWPWQAAVLKTEGKVNIFQCGGVLIDKYHVLTVAHCVFHLYQYNDYPIKVRLGEWDTQTTTEFLAHEDYKVSKIIVHPDFRNTSLWNDIAILRLEDPVLFAPHIDTVCLPQYDEIFAGQNCVVTGWGKDAYKGSSFSNVMKEVSIGVIDPYKCEEMLRKTRLGRFFKLHEGFICAGGESGLDSCKGDGGGPLVCFRKDRTYALAGIVSWGIDCGQPQVPGVYVKIQKYLDWISQNTGTKLQDYWPKH